MKKMRKGKKMLLFLIAIIITIIAVVIIVNLVNKEPTKKPGTGIEYEQVIQLPEVTYSGMEVRNIQMQYLKDNDETVLKMDIYNTTQEKVENEHFTAVLIGADENIVAQRSTWIEKLDVGEQCNVNVIWDGDLTATKQIKLIEK